MFAVAMGVAPVARRFCQHTSESADGYATCNCRNDAIHILTACIVAVGYEAPEQTENGMQFEPSWVASVDVK